MNEIHHITTSKGKSAIGYNGYLYRQDRKHTSTISWRCLTTSCKGRLVTTTEITQPVESGTHSHLPDPHLVIQECTKNRMKERVKSDPVPIPTIYKQETARMSNSIPNERIVMPTFNEIRTVLYRARQSKFPQFPESVHNIEVPPHLSKTLSGKEFILNYNRDKGMLVIATSDNLKILSESETYYMDGTFDVVPKIFAQLFTIHAFFNAKQIPLIFSLLPNKNSSTYVTLFRTLKDEAMVMNWVLNPKVFPKYYRGFIQPPGPPTSKVPPLSCPAKLPPPNQPKIFGMFQR